MLAGFDFTDVGARKKTILNEAAAAEGHLAGFGRHADDDGMAEHAAKRPRIPLDGPAGDGNGFGIECWFIHHLVYRHDDGKSKVPAPLATPSLVCDQSPMYNVGPFNLQ